MLDLSNFSSGMCRLWDKHSQYQWCFRTVSVLFQAFLSTTSSYGTYSSYTIYFTLSAYTALKGDSEEIVCPFYRVFSCRAGLLFLPAEEKRLRWRSGSIQTLECIPGYFYKSCYLILLPAFLGNWCKSIIQTNVAEIAAFFLNMQLFRGRPW